jgi:hypothetical protein
MLENCSEIALTGKMMPMFKPDFERSNILVMLQMLQMATESVVENGTRGYSDQEQEILNDVVTTLREHFLLGEKESLSLRQTTVFFERTKSEVEQAPAGAVIDSEYMPYSSKVTVSLAMDWGLITGMIVTPDTATIH